MRRILSFILGLLLITSACFAQPPQGNQQQSYYKLKFLGIAPKINPKLLPDDKATDASNINLDETGAFKDRDTFGQYNSSAGILGSNSVTGLFKFYTPTAKYFIACAGANVALGTGGSFTTSITPTVNTVVPGTFWSAATFNDSEYMFNPSLPMQKYDTIISALYSPLTTPATNCAYGAVHKARLWAARSDSLPFRLYFSSLSNGDDWNTTGGYIDLPDLTQSITGLISWGGYLWIFTETNVYVLQGSTPYDFSLRKTNSVVGAIAPRSIKITDIGIFFLSRSGVYAFDGNNSNKVSDAIDPIINAISPVLIQSSCAVYDNKSRYWLSYPASTSSYNDSIIIYDSVLKEWYPYDNLNINYFERAYGGTDKGELYGGSSTNNGIIYQLQSASGTESITHSSSSDFKNDASFNTVVSSTPSILLESGQDLYTKFLSHFNGVNGSTVFTDETGKIISAVASAHLDTAQSKFGSASLNLNGTTDYATCTDSPDWNFASSPFTVELWIRFSSVAGNTGLIGQYQGGADYWSIRWVPGINQLYFASVGGGGGTIQFSSNWVPSADTWYHVAVERINTDNAATAWRMFIDGTSKTLSLVSGAWNVALGDNTGLLNIGYSQDTGFFFPGWIDEVRISPGIARWTTDFTPYTYEYNLENFGTTTSPAMMINAAGATALSTVSWTQTTPSNTKISFQTRTGATNDTVYFNGWSKWTSTNTVTFDTVSDSSSSFNPNTGFTRNTMNPPSSPQARNVLYYEEDDNVSPNCVQLAVNGIVSKNSVITKTIPVKNLSTINWITGWVKSPQTGNTVLFSMGENTPTDNTTTFNTVNANTWERWYWYIGGITSTSRDAINKIALTYVGDIVGNIYLGESWSQNYYETGDTMTSTPNDWIEYRGILGSENPGFTPEIDSVTLTYTTTPGASESALSTYYQTKWIDFGTPQLSKQYTDFLVDVYTSGSNADFYFDYDVDNGTKTGTITIPSSNTVTNNVVHLHKYFPSSIFGNTLSIKYRNDGGVTSKHTIRGMEIRYRTEPIR